MMTQITKPATVPLRPGPPHLPNVRKKIWPICLLILACWAVKVTTTSIPLTVHCAGLLVVCIAVWPLLQWYGQGRSGAPMFAMICASYGLQYGVAYLQPNELVVMSQRLEFSWETTTYALLAVAGGLLMMLFAFSWAGKVMPALRVRISMQPHQRHTYSIICLVFGLSTTLWLAVQSIEVSWGAYLVRFGSLHLNIGLVLLAYDYFRGRAQRMDKWLLAAATIGTMVAGMAVGMLEMALLPLLLLLVVRWEVRRTIPLGFLLGAAAFFFLFNSVKAEYRTIMWYRSDSVGIVDRVSLWPRLAGDAVKALITGQTTSATVIGENARRFDYLHIFCHVLDSTPTQVPYYYGSTYSYFLAGWVPRVIWPGKPSAQESNNTLCVDYDLLTVEQTKSTMMTIGQVAEAYANFGVFGLILIMGIHGIFYRSLDIALNTSANELASAVYIATLISFLNGIGSATAAFFFNGIQGAFVGVGGAMLFSMLSTNETRPRPMPSR